MQYRKFGNTRVHLSILGFGCMRLPTKDGAIDEGKAKEMIDYAIDHGINYFDTAYFYHDGTSETFLGKVLIGPLRQKVKIATKMPSHLIATHEDLDRYFKEQLDRLQTDYIDFYHLHMLNKDLWPKLRDLKVIEWLEDKKREQRIGYIGFSFHDENHVFQEIIDSYDWEFTLLQHNYMDINNQAGSKGVAYAYQKNIPVFIMEPLLGGKLAAPVQSIQEIWNKAPVKRTPVEWALQWLWNQKAVTMVLSGMNSLEQLKENIDYANASGIHQLSEAELSLFEKVRETYRQLSPIQCTECGYCLPCPQKVNIPRNFKLYNDGKIYNNIETARGGYAWLSKAAESKIIPFDSRAIHCIQCGICDPKCPQKLPISRWMPLVHQVLGEHKSYEECPLV